MAELFTRFKRCLPTKRRLIQLYAALLYNAHLKGFAEGTIYDGALKSVCVPGLNCYSCPGAIGACPLGSLQNALAGAKVRAPYYVLGLLMLFGLTCGRLICGFLCPFGLIQELLHKLPTPKIKKSRVTRALSWCKYLLLVVLVVLIPLCYAARSVPLPAFCKYICPAGTLEGAIGLLAHPGNADLLSMLNGLFTGKFLILIAVAVLAVFLYRVFCRFLCPLGAIYSLFSRVALLGVQVDADACTGCGRCVACCPVDIRHVGDRECIQCGACQSACPVQAIHWKGVKKSAKRRPLLVSTLAIAVLAGLLIYVNLPVEASAPEPIVTESALPVGREMGMLCPDFTVDTVSGAPFHLADQRGKVVVINFWATWCTPCIRELPYFQQLQNEYGDDVAVLALHSSLVTEDWQAWLSRLDYTLPFALDADGNILGSLGGSAMLPQTVILDKDGVIVYNQAGSVTYSLLESLVAPLLTP